MVRVMRDDGEHWNRQQEAMAAAVLVVVVLAMTVEIDHCYLSLDLRSRMKVWMSLNR